MTATSAALATPARAGDRAVIRAATGEDLAAADAVLRDAFDRFTGADHLFGDIDYLYGRFRAHPERMVVAELDGEVVASNIVSIWGRVGWFGPLSVDPRWWDQGLAHPLVEAGHDLLRHSGATEFGLFTFAHSPKHVSLYARHGYWPGALVLVTARPVPEPSGTTRAGLFGPLPDTGRAAVLSEVTGLCGVVHPGLDLADEVVVTERLGLGDTVLVDDDAGLCAVAVCHVGARTEAGSGTCHVKAAVVRPGQHAEHGRLTALLDAVDGFARDRGAATVTAGVSTARRECARTLLERGHRIVLQGVAMHRGGVAHHRRGVWALDDWR